MSTIKTLPLEERPRERLSRFGACALSTIELLAILLGSGTRNRSVIQLATDLLSHFRSLRALSEASIQELQEVKGIGLARAIQLHAAFALSGRKEEPETQIFNTPEKVYAFIRSELEMQKTEALLVILMDVRLQCIHREILSKGTLTELLFHPRDVLHLAIKHRAHSMIIAHNHPSGDSTPSKEDFEMTKFLSMGCKLMGICFLDHLILGRKNFVSLARDRFQGPDFLQDGTFSAHTYF